MHSPRVAFFSGVGLTALLAAAALGLARLPGVSHLGPLTVAMLLGLGWSARAPGRPDWRAGTGFSARTLLRAGIVLLGVRLNLELVLHAGRQIVLLDVSIIAAGVIGITYLGRRLGLDSTLACLIAVDSSICGASAVAATAPALRARDDETALVIPMCSLLGTAVVLGYSVVQQVHPLSHLHYGLLAGSTLHEVAQVMAAVAPVPEAVDVGTVTKLTRVVLLVPTVFFLRWWMKRSAASPDGRDAASVPKPWFVLGFLAVAIGNSAASHLGFVAPATLRTVDQAAINASSWLMAMAMAGMGLHVDFARLRANGLRTLGTAVIGWCGIATLAVVEISLFSR